MKNETSMNSNTKANFGGIRRGTGLFGRTCLGGGLLVAALCLPRGAQAQERFGDKGQFAITAEDLMGFYSETETVHPDTGNVSNTSTRFSFLFNTRADGAATFASPKLGLHYFIIPSLSLGGTLGFESRSGDVTTQIRGVSTTTDKPSSTTFVFLPKVGYALMLNDILGFWFRGGPGVAVDSSHPNNNDLPKVNTTFWLLSLDALFVVTPLPHVGFYVGPGFDFSFAGSASTTTNVGGGTQTTSVDTSYTRFSLGFGMLAYF